jgi:hypothetical protein
MNETVRKMMITKTFTINAGYEFTQVELKLAKLNKQADKLGFARAVITDSVSFMQEEFISSENKYRFVSKMTLTVEAEELKFGDYSFVAAFDHSIGNTPIVKSKVGEVVPESYLTAVSTNCDHCNIKRQRNNTFLFKDTNGYKQVGSTCLKEFFGIDPTKHLDWLGAFGSFDEEFERGPRPVFCEGVELSVQVAIAMVAKHGFTSRKAANAYAEASNGEAMISTTSDRVLDYLNPPPTFGTKVSEETIQYRNEIGAAVEANVDEAKALIAWGIEYFATESGEYAHNMVKFLGEVAIPAKYMGYLVSVIAAKARFDNANVEKEVVVSENNFVGEVGAKVNLTVKVNKVIAKDGNYGTTYIVIMTEVATGNNVIWFASVNVCDEGETVTLKGTVKAHNVRDDKNQTVLTRCKVLEVVA